MGTSHHWASGPEPEESALMKRFIDQLEQRAKREYPRGRLGGHDEGALALAVSSDPATGTVTLDFGKPVAGVGLSPSEVAGLVRLLVHHARRVATEPLAIDIG